MVTKKEYESASESDTEQPEKKPVKKVTPKKHEKVTPIQLPPAIRFLSSILGRGSCF